MDMTDRQKDAVEFLQSACRNWRTVPKLSHADLDDVADALDRRDKQRKQGAKSPALLALRKADAARIAALVEALEPFAEAADNLDG